MTEYLNKKAVLEWFGLMHLEYSHNAAVSEFIESGIEIFESGAFDAPEMEYINAYWAREGLIKHQEAEVQRLRAAFSSRGVFNALRYYQKQGLCEGEEYDEIEKALEAISTTEPTDPSISKTQIENIKKLLNDPAYHGMYRSGIFDVLEELGITIPGINAPEGDGNDA